jgi:hypothetical protein
MSELRLADVPALRSEKPILDLRRADMIGPVRRRSVLKTGIAIGGAVGLSVLGLLPPARKALATHGVSYEIKPLPCDNFQESLPLTCAVPCGDSMIFSGACVLDTTHHRYGFHKDNANWNLRPNDCSNTANKWDGWKWAVSPCEGCHVVHFRCHDGWKVEPGNDIKSICKWNTFCGP